MLKRIYIIICISLVFFVILLFINKLSIKKESNYVEKCYQELRLLTYNNWELESTKKDLELQQDYSNILISLMNDKEIQQMAIETLNNLYNLKKEKLYFTVKSLNDMNTKYQFAYSCDELNKSQCEYISFMLGREVLSKLDKDYGITGGRSIDDYYCK